MLKFLLSVGAIAGVVALALGLGYLLAGTEHDAAETQFALLAIVLGGIVAGRAVQGLRTQPPAADTLFWTATVALVLFAVAFGLNTAQQATAAAVTRATVTAARATATASAASARATVTAAPLATRAAYQASATAFAGVRATAAAEGRPTPICGSYIGDIGCVGPALGAAAAAKPVLRPSSRLPGPAVTTAASPRTRP